MELMAHVGCHVTNCDLAPSSRHTILDDMCTRHVSLMMTPRWPTCFLCIDHVIAFVYRYKPRSTLCAISDTSLPQTMSMFPPCLSRCLAVCLVPTSATGGSRGGGRGGTSPKAPSNFFTNIILRRRILFNFYKFTYITIMFLSRD